MSWLARRRAYRDAGKHRRAVRRRRRAHVSPMVDARALVAHFVTDEAFAAGRRDGRYMALCGLDVLPAPLTIGEAGHCPRCVAS